MNAAQLQSQGHSLLVGSIGGTAPVAAPSEVETALSRLSNSLDILVNAQVQLASRLHMVSRPQAPEAVGQQGVREAMSCPVSEALQGAREVVDQVTARINLSASLLAI
jgi:transposase